MGQRDRVGQKYMDVTGWGNITHVILPLNEGWIERFPIFPYIDHSALPPSPNRTAPHCSNVSSGVLPRQIHFDMRLEFPLIMIVFQPTIVAVIVVLHRSAHCILHVERMMLRAFQHAALARETQDVRMRSSRIEDVGCEVAQSVRGGYRTGTTGAGGFMLVSV